MTERKSDRRVQYTKMFLREALIKLMKEKPIGKITPTELCREADINRNTFYAHYTCPGDLLSEIEGELYENIIQYVTGYSDSSLHLLDVCHAIAEQEELCKVILSDYGDKDFLLRIMNKVYDIVIDDWRKQAPGASEDELQYFFSYCTNGSVAVIRDWVLGGMKFSYEKIARILEQANSLVLTAFCKKNG